jgi:hypothetical protein
LSANIREIGVFTVLLSRLLMLSSAVGVCDVPIVSAAVSNALVVSSMLLLHYYCKQSHFCFRPYCVDRPVVAFIPAVACNSAVVGSHPLLLSSLLLLIAGCTADSCFPAAVGFMLLLGFLQLWCP